MTTPQRFILGAGMFLVILMGLFPPWEVIPGGESKPVGYSFIMSPPTERRRSTSGMRISLGQLYAQLGITILATGMGVLIVKPGKESTAKETP